MGIVVFLTLILAVIDVGQIMYIKSSLSDRVQQALRRAAVEPHDDAAIRNLVLYGQPEALADPRFSFLRLAPENVLVERAGGQLRISIVNYRYELVSPWFEPLAPRAVTAAVPLEYQATAGESGRQAR